MKNNIPLLVLWALPFFSMADIASGDTGTLEIIGAMAVENLAPGGAGDVALPRSYQSPHEIDYVSAIPAGSIIVKTRRRRLLLVLSPGRAREYQVGVGRQGFTWSGKDIITRKAQWPAWRPPAKMIAREQRKGRILPAMMPGGEDNPLGARALYIGQSEYRIHGTNEAWSIGKAVSSGCIRMLNEDVIDLYDRVPAGASVVVE